MKSICISFCFILLITYNTIAQKQASTRKDLNMNIDWAFHPGDLSGAEKKDFNDEDWNAVSIPHVMRLEAKHNGGNKIYQGIGWYRKYFKIGKQEQQKRITIHFDGVQTNCTVFLNGEKLATHHGGYLGFVVDITKKVKFSGNNILAIRVSNEDDPQTPPGKPLAKLDFNYYGGIYRDVKLKITNPVYISDPLEVNRIAGGGLFVSYPMVNKERATVQVKTHIVNQSGNRSNLSLTTLIQDHAGKTVASSTKNVSKAGEVAQELTVKQPKLWHPDHPYLYKVISRVFVDKKLVDETSTPAGIRTISFKSPIGKVDGFYINGEKLYLRGANRHQNYQTIGDAASNSMQYRDALQIKKGGFNSVRAAHYPQSPAFLDACDELGLLVVECEPGWQYFSKDSVFLNRSYQNVRQMIRRDRNRPSIFLWETSLNESPTADFWAKEVVRIAHQEMPGDQMFTSDDFFAKGKKFYDVSYKVINEDGTDPMPEMPSLTREWGDTWLADVAKENSLRASRMYTEKGMIAQCILRQNALNGSMLESEGAYWDHAKLDANPRLGGYFLWSYNDYTRGSDPITAFSGVVDIDRYPKFAYYQLQAMQSARNPVYGPMVFIASFNNLPAVDHNIMIFSNCDRVKLYRNGKFLQEKSRIENNETAEFIAAKGGSPYFMFNTSNYEGGEIKAEAYLDDKLVATNIINTPGVAHHLEIVLDHIKPIADGVDMIPFYVKVCDQRGNLVSNTQPLTSFDIDIVVTGAGSLIGADTRGVDISQPTEGGVAYGIIKTSHIPGSISITATAKGLKNGKADLTTIPYAGNFVLDGSHAKWKREKNQQNTASATSAKANAINTIDLRLLNIKILGNKENMLLGNILDDKINTIWTVERQDLPTAMSIDLGELFDITGSKIIWGKDSDWYTYSIEVSTDEKSWISIFKDKSVSGQEYQPEIFDAKRIRYIKVTFSGVQPEKSKLAISDLKFYGKKSN